MKSVCLCKAYDYAQWWTKRGIFVCQGHILYNFIKKTASIHFQRSKGSFPTSLGHKSLNYPPDLQKITRTRFICLSQEIVHILKRSCKTIKNMFKLSQYVSYNMSHNFAISRFAMGHITEHVTQHVRQLTWQNVLYCT